MAGDDGLGKKFVNGDEEWGSFPKVLQITQVNGLLNMSKIMKMMNCLFFQ